jgi:hypothetical protein
VESARVTVRRFLLAAPAGSFRPSVLLRRANMRCDRVIRHITKSAALSSWPQVHQLNDAFAFPYVILAPAVSEKRVAFASFRQPKKFEHKIWRRFRFDRFGREFAHGTRNTPRKFD